MDSYAPNDIDFDKLHWEKLDSFVVSSGTLKVVLSNNSTGTVAADSIRVERNTGPDVSLTIDDGDPIYTYTETGSWESSGRQMPYSTGAGNFPLWESCLLRGPVFRVLFKDWENGTEMFPDLNDPTSDDPNETLIPTVAYYNQTSFFGGQKTLVIAGQSNESLTISRITIAPDGSTIDDIRVAWGATATHCAGERQIVRSAVQAIRVQGVPAANVQIDPSLAALVTYDAVVPAGEIHGLLWNDINADMHHDLPEPGLRSWLVTLDTDPVSHLLEPSSYTRANGSYAFDNLVLGNYSVVERRPADWKTTYPSSSVQQSASLTTINPVLTTADFGNVAVTGDLGWIKALGQYLNKLVKKTQSPLELLGADASLDDLIHIPFLDQGISGTVDFTALFAELDQRLYKNVEIVANAAPSSFNLTSPARFLIDAGGLSPVEVVVPPTSGTNSNLVALIAQLNTALLAAGLANTVRFDSDSGKLKLVTQHAGLTPSLTLSTLQLVAAQAGPPYGQLLLSAGPIDTFNVEIVRSLPDPNSTINNVLPLVPQPPVVYSFKIGAVPPTANETSFVHTQDNINLQDLADDLNAGLMSQHVTDVKALVDPGSDGVLNTPDDKLVLAAVLPSVTKITVVGGSGTRLGFGNNQSVDATTNSNPAAAVLKFSGGHVAADRAYDSIQTMLPLIEAELRAMSDPPLPSNYLLDPVYDAEHGTVQFHFRLEVST